VELEMSNLSDNDFPKIPNLKFIEKVGDGGMATVWKALDTSKLRMVAVKILNREFSEDDNEIRQFQAEERLMETIRHPGIVQAYEFNNIGDIWYYSMEFVDGYTFSSLLQRKQHVRESDCLLICQSVASALNFAWNEHGIVHCDLKPENIMINSDGIVKLTDLGISHQFEFNEGPQDVPEHVLGTPAYISPEQVYGDVELDCRSDIYSLAATLYHLSTGRIMFSGRDNEGMMRAHCDETVQACDPRAYRPELSEGFSQLLESMLVKDRDYRVASWADVYAMCQEIEEGHAFKPRESSSPSSIRLMQ
jgi:serine/threonine-protein kinase